MATFEDFQKIDIRVGRIIEVLDLKEARNPSYKIIEIIDIDNNYSML